MNAKKSLAILAIALFAGFGGSALVQAAGTTTKSGQCLASPEGDQVCQGASNINSMSGTPDRFPKQEGPSHRVNEATR